MGVGIPGWPGVFHIAGQNCVILQQKLVPNGVAKIGTDYINTLGTYGAI